MNLTELFSIAGIIQSLTVELLACQVKHMIINDVVAVKISCLLKNAENLPAENILSEKRCYSALA